MTRIEKMKLFNELLELEEKNDIGNLTSSDRAEFQMWIKEALEQEPKWIPVSEKLPNKNQWVLVITENYQKLVDIMCYQGIRICRHDVGNGWEEYECPSWTSGHGDIQDSHPIAWTPLPKPMRLENKE